MEGFIRVEIPSNCIHCRYVDGILKECRITKEPIEIWGNERDESCPISEEPNGRVVDARDE